MHYKGGIMNYDLVPENVKDSIVRYVDHRIEPGSFLIAVLSNNLSEAVGRADHINIRLLPEIVNFIYNKIPAGCWGSFDKVSKWLEER